MQLQEAERVPIKKNPKWPTLRHIIIKMTDLNDEERILKAASEKQEETQNRVPIRLAADFSTETYKREGNGKKYST